VECGQPFGVFVDCADTPDRLAVCLKALRRVTRGKLYCILGSDDDERREDRPLLGRVLERGADLGVITGGRAETEPLQTVHDILDGYERPARAHVIPSRDQAIRWLLGRARPGDSVLIAGGSRMCGLGSRQQPGVCPDAEIARSWLYQSAAPAMSALKAVGSEQNCDS